MAVHALFAHDEIGRTERGDRYALLVQHARVKGMLLHRIDGLGGRFLMRPETRPPIPPSKPPVRLTTETVLRSLPRRISPLFLLTRGTMHPSADEFLRTLLETLDELPPELARRLEEVVKKEHVDRSQAIRQLFEEVAAD